MLNYFGRAQFCHVSKKKLKFNIFLTRIQRKNKNRMTIRENLIDKEKFKESAKQESQDLGGILGFSTTYVMKMHRLSMTIAEDLTEKEKFVWTSNQEYYFYLS